MSGHAEASETVIANIRAIIPHLRLAISAAEQGGAAKLAITSNFATGGKIIASFDTGFIEDVASLAAALQSERDSRDREVERLAREIDESHAQIKALALSLRGFIQSGCYMCSGDCGSANPPVTGCPMQQAAKALGEDKAALVPGEKS